MEVSVRAYLSRIGRRGGQKSRRQLDSGTARDMVRLREARRAFRRFHTQCFWSTDPTYTITVRDIPWVAEQLMKFGGRAGWDAGARLCRSPYQEEVARLLSANRTSDSYLAGGAALHLEPNTTRYSNDLDYFHDAVERVAEAFAQDERTLRETGHGVTLDVQLRGYIRATVSRGVTSTKMEWAHDSAWRFMPTVRNDVVGFVLHPIDLAVNKLLALAGRDEPRDFLDIIDLHRGTLSLGALCWAAAGKDPGFTPFSLLAILRRRGKYHADDFVRLHLARPIDLPSLKQAWLAALADADAFVRGRPPGESGCLYYSPGLQRFVTPGPSGPADAVPHYGRPGGVLPRIVENT